MNGRTGRLGVDPVRHAQQQREVESAFRGVKGDATTPQELISPLRRLLLEADFESLVVFLSRCRRVSVSLSRNHGQKWSCVIRVRNGFQYGPRTGDIAKHALCCAMAEFLSGERLDFHEYEWSEESP